MSHESIHESILYYITIHDVKLIVIHDSQYLRIDSALVNRNQMHSLVLSTALSVLTWTRSGGAMEGRAPNRVELVVQKTCRPRREGKREEREEGEG